MYDSSDVTELANLEALLRFDIVPWVGEYALDGQLALGLGPDESSRYDIVRLLMNIKDGKEVYI